MERIKRKIPTPQNLANVALHYLERFAASEASLRRVLLMRLQRAAFDNPEFASDHERKSLLRSAIETIIETHKRTGVLNDATFAEMKVNSLRRQGRSRRAIEQKLASKGITNIIADEALIQHADGEEAEEVEFKAALAYARRKKIGAWRLNPCDQDRKRKELAALARAGFSRTTAQRVLKQEPDEVLDSP